MNKQADKGAAEAISSKDRSELVETVMTQWHGNGYEKRGDHNEPEVAAFFGRYEPVMDLECTDPQSFMGLVYRVWYPLIEAMKPGEDRRDLAKTWNHLGGAG